MTSSLPHAVSGGQQLKSFLETSDPPKEEKENINEKIQIPAVDICSKNELERHWLLLPTFQKILRNRLQRKLNSPTAYTASVFPGSVIYACGGRFKEETI